MFEPICMPIVFFVLVSVVVILCGVATMATVRQNTRLGRELRRLQQKPTR